MSSIKLVIIGAISFPYLLFAQDLKGSVEFIYKIPAEKKIYKTAFLYFNDSISNFVYNKIGIEKPKENRITSDVNSVNVTLKQSDEIGSILYRNFKSKEIRMRFTPIGKLFNSYFYDDTWIEIPWKILEKFKRIGKFKAQKAVGSFRGRTYTVWFTEEIPLPYGPWKLFGLPGLILEAKDSEKMFQIEFVSIKYPCDDCEIAISKPTAKEEKTIKEYVDFRDNFNDYVFKKIKSKLPRKMASKFRQIPKKDNVRKYRDEKIFEWEAESEKD